MVRDIRRTSDQYNRIILKIQILKKDEWDYFAKKFRCAILSEINQPEASDRMKNLQSMRARIAEHYRSAIRQGILPPGSMLPAARTLAVEWHTAESNVHQAIATLAREGLVNRRPRAGTFVSDAAREMRSVAIFLDWFHLRRGEDFTRLLVEMLEREFASRRIGCRVIYDTPGGAGMRELRQLASSRRIQAVVLRSLPAEHFPFFSHLPVPFAALSSMRIPNRVTFHSAEVARKMVRMLAGCRGLGLLAPGIAPDFVEKCRMAAKEENMELRPEWIFTELEDIPAGASTTFAYHAMTRLWNAPARPDGLMVFSDDLAGGIAMAGYRWGFRIPEDFRLAIHTTSENPVIFPFECTLLEHSIAEIAALLAGQLDDLWNGRTPRAGHLTMSIREIKL